MLDTMVFSYLLSGHPRYAMLAERVFSMVESGEVPALTTTMTLAELLTVPAQAQDQQALHDYELYLTHFPNLQLIPLDNSLARETALVRAETGLRMPDAVQVAAARLSGADGIVTNDRRWRGKVVGITLLLLDDYL